MVEVILIFIEIYKFVIKTILYMIGIYNPKPNGLNRSTGVWKYYAAYTFLVIMFSGALLQTYGSIALLLFVPYFIRIAVAYRNKKNNLNDKNALSVTDKKKIDPTNINIKTQDKKTISIAYPERGVFILASTGSGKSESLVVPIIDSILYNERVGITYDFSFPDLYNIVELYRTHYNSQIPHYFINFKDPLKSSRVNPINPKLIHNVNYAREMAVTLVQNLSKEKKTDFWLRSATDILTASIWYFKEEHPKYCYLPYVFSFILSPSKDIIRALGKNTITQQLIAGLQGASDAQAGGQIAGTLGTLQSIISQINTPEICFILGGDDFSLDINDPLDPKYLTIGNDPKLPSAYSPLVSLIVNIASKEMNEPHKIKSFLLLDEGPTLFLPEFEKFTNTARKNGVGVIYIAQDLSQMYDIYGKEKAEAIIGSLNNQFYGRLANGQTAEYVSKLFGKSDREFFSESISNQSSMSGGSSSESISKSLHEREVIKASEFLKFSPGEFAGLLVDDKQPIFRTKFAMMERPKTIDTGYSTAFKEIEFESYQDEKKVYQVQDIRKYFDQVRADVNNILNQ